jgi:hypothetical protein
MDELKYKLDTEILINDERWIVTHYRRRFGVEITYTLQSETLDGIRKSMELNERALTEIIRSGSNLISTIP